MKVIGVVGLPATGKGEFSRIAGELGIPVVVMGDVVRGEVRQRGLPLSDESMGRISGELRQKYGRDALATLSIPAIEAAGADIVLVDGIRSDAEVVRFREHFECFTLVAVESPFDLRIERIRSRGREDDIATEQMLTARDEREIGWGLGEAILMADHCLTNDGGMNEYEIKVRSVLRKFMEDA
ncbi:MAG TPA: flagellar hook-basal body complex protein FliE [Methanoculleus sp.]|nr:flagellar hook-basal body complex protein FliE [Methanoculleus sp.]